MDHERPPYVPRPGKDVQWRAIFSALGIRMDNSVSLTNARIHVMWVIVTIVAIVIVARLIFLQVFVADDLAARAQQQRQVVVEEPAYRGVISDRNGQRIGYTLHGVKLAVHPNQLRSFMEENHRIYGDTDPEALPPDERMELIATELPRMFAGTSTKVKKEDIFAALRDTSSTYRVLVYQVDPDLGAKIKERFPEISVERQDLRQYPNGAVGANVVGNTSNDNEGQAGLELSQDGQLQGLNGSVTYERGVHGQIIPGSRRDVHPAVDGSNYTLTLDMDAQAYVQQQVQQAKDLSGAKSASAVVMDAHSAEILAMATSDTYDPNGEIGRQEREGKVRVDRNTAHVYEPGSVAKIMTAAAAIEEKKTTPDEVLTVPGSITIAGATVKDAWEHGDLNLTTTGVFGKSSNVGTLQLAERVGEEKMYDYFTKFGVGQSPELGMPAEASGSLLPPEQWTAGTFANLPIGQGMNMSVVQMAGIYQALANGGTRVQPRLIKSIESPDGTVLPMEPQKETPVVTPETARTVLDMFRAVTQSDPTGVNQGTGHTGSIEGYQTSGKTGTAQKIEDNGAYSNSRYWITFAGVAPADSPRFVIAIMLDEPQRGTDGGAGGSAAPLFRDLMSWMLNHYNIPLSPDPGPTLMLERK